MAIAYSRLNPSANPHEWTPLTRYLKTWCSLISEFVHNEPLLPPEGKEFEDFIARVAQLEEKQHLCCCRRCGKHLKWRSRSAINFCPECGRENESPAVTINDLL